MDCTYGVGITNRFAVFIDGEQDETELIKEQEKVVEKKKAEKTKSAEKENKTKVTTKTKIVSAKKVIKEPTPTKISDNQAPKKDVENNKPRTNMGPRGAGNQNDRSSRFGSGNRFNDTNGPDSRDMEEKKNRKNKEVGDFRGDNEGRRGGIGGGRGGPGGMRGGRGRGRGRGGFDFRGKREYDRQSGSDRSGVKAVDKRDGAGSHNWGTMKDDLEQREQLNATRTSEDNQDWAEKSGDDNPTTETKEIENETVTDEPKEPVEEEPLEMTLDEYKRQQAAARMVPKYNLRKAGEGEDDAMWKKTFRLEKKKTEEDDEEETDEEEEDEVIRRGRAKQTVNIDIQFSDSRHGQRGGRGGRGGGGGRGGSRGTDRPFRGRGGGGGNPGFRGGGGGGNTGFRGGGGGNTGFRGGDGSNTGFRGDGSSTGFRGDGSSTGFRGDGSSTGFRGAGRGGGTRTMPNAPNMLDENDFPSLT